MERGGSGKNIPGFKEIGGGRKLEDGALEAIKFLASLPQNLSDHYHWQS